VLLEAVRGGALRIATLSSSSSHRTSSSRWRLGAIEVHRDWNIRVGWQSSSGVVLGGFRVLSPIRVLVPAITVILLVRRILEPTSLVTALISSLLGSSGTEDILDHLSRLDTLDRFLFGSFIGIRDRRSENVFNHAPRETFYEEFDGFWVREVISRDSGEPFEVIRVLVDFRPLQSEGF